MDGRRKRMGRETEVQTGVDGMGFGGAMEPDVPDTTTKRKKNEDIDGVVPRKPKKKATPKPKTKPKPKQECPVSRADVVSSFRLSDTYEDDGSRLWEWTRLVVCLKFSGDERAAVQHVVGYKPVAIPGASGVSTSDGGSAKQTVQVPETSRSLTRTCAPFERQWVDETQNFSMKEVVATLRSPKETRGPLPGLYDWFDDAVPIDAIFPPGIPLSAKEISAYYPRHIRWTGVMVRLANNSYFGADLIAIQAFFRAQSIPPYSGGLINKYFRDVLKREIPGFKGYNGFKGKPDRNMHTGHLRPGLLLESKHQGFVVPTFDDLLNGLTYLPAGLDARSLTQCLVWYLNTRDMFTPRLKLNVLHTQSLIRALREPLKSYGPQNLDMNALREWKENGQFAKRPVKDEERIYEAEPKPFEDLKTSHVKIDRQKVSVEVGVVLPLRHILTFPFLSMIGMAGKALEMGIEKAEARKAARGIDAGIDGKGEAATRASTAEIGNEGPSQTIDKEKLETHQDDNPPKQQDNPLKQQDSLPKQKAMPANYRIPKRKRPDETPTQNTSKKVALTPTSSYQKYLPTAPHHDLPARPDGASPAGYAAYIANAPRTPTFRNWQVSFNDPSNAMVAAPGYRSGPYYNHQMPYPGRSSDYYDNYYRARQFQVHPPSSLRRQYQP